MLLAGLWNGIANTDSYCDACIWVDDRQGQVRDAARRHLRRHDERQHRHEPRGVLDPERGEYPRSMTWQFAKCPDTGPMMYEFQTGSNEYWTSLWVRNARVPLAKIEVQSVEPRVVDSAHARPATGRSPTRAASARASSRIRSTGVDGQQVSRHLRLAERRDRRRVPDRPGQLPVTREDAEGAAAGARHAPVGRRSWIEVVRRTVRPTRDRPATTTTRITSTHCSSPRMGLGR